jgi:general secretion pathway protein F
LIPDNGEGVSGMSNRPGSNGAGSGGGLTGDEALELSAQLSGLARAGMPLASSLAALAEELPRGRLRRAMLELAGGLEAGRAVGEALDDPAGRVPPHVRGLVAAGVRSGRLGEILGEFSQYATTGIELRRRLRLNLAYPTLSLLVTLLVFAFVGIAVIPQFEAIFRDFGVPLPGITLIVLGLAHRTSGVWNTLMVISGLGVAGVLGAYLFLPTATLRGLAAQVPLLGGVWRWTSLAEFCHWLALLLEHRLPMPEALRLAGEGVQDSSVQSATRHMAEDVEDGKTLADAMSGRRPFPPRLPRLLLWGESRGSLPEVLHMAGDMFAARASAHSSFAAAALSVACFVLILLGVNLIILGLMLPMISLISRLSG